MASIGIIATITAVVTDPAMRIAVTDPITAIATTGRALLTLDTNMGALAGVIITIAAGEFSEVQNYRPIKKARTLTRLLR